MMVSGLEGRLRELGFFREEEAKGDLLGACNYMELQR